MEKIRELITNQIETTFENAIKQDDEYKALEKEKNEIINRLKANLSDKDFQDIEKLLDCVDGQSFIAATGFCCVRILDIEKLLAEKI